MTYKGRAIILTLLLVVGFSALSSRLIFIQIYQHEHWEEIAEKDYARKVSVPAVRGLIFDRDGEQLVHNKPVRTIIADWFQMTDYRVLVNGIAAARGVSVDEVIAEYGAREPAVPRLMPDYMDYIASVLSEPLGMEFDELRSRLSFKKRKEAILAAGLTKDQADKIELLLKESHIRGIHLRNGVERFYPNGEILSHVLGFVNRGQVGQEGIARTCNSVLSGADGFRYIQVDRKGREITAYRGDEKKAKQGSNVKLTIDLDLQVILEEEIRAAHEEFRAERFMALLVDPFTGDILAMANTPSFDPNTLEGELKNSLITDVYEPGSTFKLIAAAAALDLGVATPNTTVFCENGLLQEGKLQIRDHHPYGYLTVGGVLQKSSNPGAFKLARMAGMKNYYEYVKRFGFGRETGIELTAESGGYVSMTGNLIDFSRLSYGYAVNTTPLQVAMAYAAVANGGNLMRPRLIEEVSNADGEVLRKTRPQILQRAISERTASQLRVMLQSVVGEEGTAKQAAIPGHTAAGKTGTTKKLNLEVKPYRYFAKKYFTSFAGFAPAEDPELVCVVVADNPQPRDDIPAYGGTVAAPVFSRIMRRALAHRDIAPTLPLNDDEESESDERKTTVARTR